MWNVNHPQGQGGLVAGVVCVAFTKDIGVIGAKKIVEAAGYKLTTFDTTTHIGRATVPEGEETKAVQVLTQKGKCQAERIMTHVLHA